MATALGADHLQNGALLWSLGPDRDHPPLPASSIDFLHVVASNILLMPQLIHHTWNVGLRLYFSWCCLFLCLPLCL